MKTGSNRQLQAQSKVHSGCGRGEVGLEGDLKGKKRGGQEEGVEGGWRGGENTLFFFFFYYYYVIGPKV